MNTPTEQKYLFKEINIECDPVDIDTEMFEKIHSVIQNSRKVDLYINANGTTRSCMGT